MHDERTVDELTVEDLVKILQEKRSVVSRVNKSHSSLDAPQQPDLLSASVSIELISRCHSMVHQLEDKLAPVLTDESKGDNKEKVCPVIDRLCNLYDALEALYERIHI